VLTKGQYNQLNFLNTLLLETKRKNERLKLCHAVVQKSNQLDCHPEYSWPRLGQYFKRKATTEEKVEELVKPGNR